MAYATLISMAELSQHLADPDWAVVDCRFSLTGAERGKRDYEQAHIAGAVYAHLDEDLCGPVRPGKTGRHPLPEVEAFVQTLSKWGIDATAQVVYDYRGHRGSGVTAAHNLLALVHAGFGDARLYAGL